MDIATYGDVAFEVSSSLVKTLTEFSHKSSARWAVHEIIGDTCKAEFIGPGQSEMTFSVTLLSEIGASPREDADDLIKMMQDGKTAAFIVGGQPIGDGEWYIEEIEQEMTAVNAQGEIHKIVLSMTLKEYF